MPPPEFSIIMPLYNSGEYVRASIDSILAQTCPDFELLVVDDGSTDAGPEAVRAIGDPRIRFHASSVNGGPASARNRGLAKASGRYIVFFDSDDVAEPCMLACLLESINATPECDFAFGRYQTIDAAGRYGTASAGGLRPESIGPELLFRNCLPTSGLMVRRACLEGVAFDESFAVASDYEMWSRIVPKGDARQVQQIINKYRSHPQNISHRKQALGDECIERIYRLQLGRLGIDPTAREIQLHSQLCKFSIRTPKEAVLAAEQWLLKLEDANTKNGVYPSSAFQGVLGEKWHAVCHSACVHGFWTWRIYRNSALARWWAPPAPQRWQLFRLSARGALRRLLGFSFNSAPGSVSL